MTTVIRAGGPVLLDRGLPYATFSDVFTVLHVVVWVVFVCSFLAFLVSGFYLAFASYRGVREGCFGERTWAPTTAPLGFVGVAVTGASLAAWAAGADVGLLTLVLAAGLVVAVGWYLARRERRTWTDYSAAQSRDAEGQL